MSVHILPNDLMNFGYLSKCCKKPINFYNIRCICTGCGKVTGPQYPARTHLQQSTGLTLLANGELKDALSIQG